MANPFVTFFNWVVGTWKAADTLGKINMVLTAATLAVGVKGFMQARQMMAKGQDILANKTSAGGKLPVIYGTRRVGAQVIYMDVSANDSRDLYVVYALSVGECDEIIGRTIELDGNPLTDTARFRDGGYIGSDKISSGSGSLNTVSQNGTGIDAGAGQFGTSPTQKYRYVMNLHHGAAAQIADPMLVASMPNWTSAHKLNGVAYIAFHAGYDKEGMWKGVPQLTVQVRGKKVFDPRDTNQTFGTVSTYKYSDNPALCFLNYITDNEVGKGLTESQINMSTFTAAANVCDTEVDQPYFNGVAKSLTWSGNAGDNFITIGGASATATWWQNKIGELIDIYDANGDGVIDGKEITDIGRNNFYDENEELIVYINDTLDSTYSSQTGTSLVKVKRFHCNGYLDANKNVMDNAKELLANMRGIFLYINGKYELSIEDTGTSTFSINDNHIIADAGISVDYGNKDKKANKVIVEFFNANKRYELDTATVLHDATPEYYSDDGDEILEIKAEFPYISDPYIAYNMGKAILTRSRNQTTMQFLGTPEMYKLNVGDIVDLTYAGLGFSGKICRVEALELQHSGLVSVSLIEYFDVYTWEVPPQEPVEELANLPSAYAVKAPTGLSFTDSNASSTDRPFISWNIPTDFPDAEYRINVVDSSSNQVLNKIVDVNNADLNFLPTGTNYVASITSLNTLGTESSPATLTFTVGDAPVGLGDVQANVITATEINVTNLSAISADLGSITAGDMNIGSGNFTVSTAGAMTATGATISGEVNATSGTFNGSISIGSGNNIFKADTNGIYLGNTSYASALFKVSPAGVVQSDKRITSGTGTTQATLSGEDATYRFWSGGTSGSTADFSVSKTGEIIAKKISIYNNEGGLIFSSDAGFSDLALTQISAVTGTPVQSVSDTFSANGDTSTSWQSITLVANTNLSVSVALNTLFGGDGFSNTSVALATADALAEIPDNFTLQMQYSSDGGSNWNNIAITSGGSGNSQQFTKTTSTNPTAQQYSVDITTESEPAFFVAFADVRKGNSLSNYGSVDANGYSNITGTITNLAGATGGTTYKFRTLVTTTDSGYNTINKVTATAPRTLTITDTSGSGFYIDNGDGSQTVPTGDITSVSVTTASSSGLTGGQTFASGAANFTLALASSIDGNKTFNDEITADALGLPSQTPSTTTNKLYNVGGSLYFNGSAVGGGGTGDITAVTAGTNLNGGGTSGAVTLNLDNTISITGTITATQFLASGGDSTPSGTTFNNVFKGVSSYRTAYFDGNGTSSSVWWGVGNNPHAALDTTDGNLATWTNDSAGTWRKITEHSTSGLNITTGGLLVGSNYVIDSSRNLTNIVNLNGSAVSSYWKNSGSWLGDLGSNGYTREYGLSMTGSSEFVILSKNGQGSTLVDGQYISYESANGFFGSYNSSYGNASGIRATAANTVSVMQLDGGTANLAVTGTLSSGAITAASTSDQILTLNQTDSSTWNYIGFQNQGTRKWYTGIDGSGQYVIGADTNNAVTFSNISGLKIGSTTFIDSSRNLTNIGTIATTGNIQVSYTGNSTNDAGIYVANDSSDWGMYINKTGTSTYGLKIAADGAYPFQIVNSSQVEKLRVDTDGNLTLAGTISSGAINSTGVVSMVTRAEIQGNGGWAYTRLKNSTSTMWDIAANPSDNSSALQFRPSGNGTNASLLSTSGNWTINGTVYATEYDLPSGGMLDWANGDARIIEGLVNNYSLSFQTWDGSNVSTALRLDGDNTATFTGNAFLKNTKFLGGNSYNENIRCNAAANDYSSFVLGAVSGDSGTGTGQWTFVRYPNSLGHKLSIRHSSTDALVFDTSSAATFTSSVTTPYLKVGGNFGNYPVSISTAQRYCIGFRNTGATNGSTNYPWFVHDSDKLIIHWNAIGDRWSLDQSGNSVNSGNVTAYSDERLKTNIQTLDSKKALQMRGVSFIKDGQEGSGVIAQEIEEIAPELVLTADDEMGTKSVAYGNLVGYLIETVKDQQKQIDELKQRLDNDSSN